MAEQKIIQGDCLEVMKTFPDKSFDLVLTDPPYGIGDKVLASQIEGNSAGRKDWGADKWDVRPTKEFFDEMFRVSKNQIIWGANYFTEFLPNSRGWLVWDKIIPEGWYSSSHAELAFTSYDKKLLMFREAKSMSNGFMNKEASNVHPTQKSKELMRWCLSLNPEVKTILDPFVGSGTTVVAAKEMQLDCTGIEISPKYCKIAQERLDATPNSLFASTP